MKKALYILKKNGPTELVLERNKLKHFTSFIFIILFCIAWFWGLLSMFNQEEETMEPSALVNKVIKNPFLWVFWAAGLGILYTSIKPLKIALFGEKLIFNKARNSYSVNSSEKCLIDEIKHLQIREFQDSDGDNDYRLSAVTKDNIKHFIDRSSDKHGIQELAEEIADFFKHFSKIKKLNRIRFKRLLT